MGGYLGRFEPLRGIASGALGCADPPVPDERISLLNSSTGLLDVEERLIVRRRNCDARILNK